MFQTLFNFIRTGIKNAILNGIQDAQAEITGFLEVPEAKTIGATADVEPNGKVITRRKTVTR